MADQAGKILKPSWLVAAEQDGMRLDAFLRQTLPHLSRRAVEKALKENSFLINRKVGRKGDMLKSADSVSFKGDPLWLESAPAAETELRVAIVYEDDFIIAVDKPAGMPTHGFSARDTHTLANFLITRFPMLADIGASRWEAGLVHRLDRETSGLVLAAKTAAAFTHLRQQFRRREIGKWYWALVAGEVERAGIIDYPIAHDTRDRRKMRALVGNSANRAKIKTWPATTRYRRLATARQKTLVELEMFTGVTHQLRVHLAAIGHPIVNDQLYGANAVQDSGLERHFLHAKRLRLRHPQHGREIEIEAALAPELTAVLDKLKIRP